MSETTRKIERHVRKAAALAVQGGAAPHIACGAYGLDDEWLGVVAVVVCRSGSATVHAIVFAGLRHFSSLHASVDCADSPALLRFALGGAFKAEQRIAPAHLRSATAPAVDEGRHSGGPSLVAAIQLGPDLQPVRAEVAARYGAVRELLDGQTAFDRNAAALPVTHGLRTNAEQLRQLPGTAYRVRRLINRAFRLHELMIHRRFTFSSPT